MLHYTINRPVGAQWGESDLAPVLKWLSRYSGWLEDRARLNRFRNSFLFVVKAPFISEEDRKPRQANLAAHPPRRAASLFVMKARNGRSSLPNWKAPTRPTRGWR